MSDAQLLFERLQTVLAALERIPRRCAAISKPGDFLASDAGKCSGAGQSAFGMFWRMVISMWIPNSSTRFVRNAFRR